jgi:hypothetical protein
VPLKSLEVKKDSAGDDLLAQKFKPDISDYTIELNTAGTLNIEAEAEDL